MSRVDDALNSILEILDPDSPERKAYQGETLFSMLRGLGESTIQMNAAAELEASNESGDTPAVPSDRSFPMVSTMPVLGCRVHPSFTIKKPEQK